MACIDRLLPAGRWICAAVGSVLGVIASGTTHASSLWVVDSIPIAFATPVALTQFVVPKRGTVTLADGARIATALRRVWRASASPHQFGDLSPRSSRIRSNQSLMAGGCNVASTSRGATVSENWSVSGACAFRAGRTPSRKGYPAAFPPSTEYRTHKCVGSSTHASVMLANPQAPGLSTTVHNSTRASLA